MKKINLADAPEFFRGACKPFVRMNQQLLDFYSSPETWKIRSRCASGMAVVFETDSENLEISVEFGEAARQVFSTDVEVTDIITTFDGAGVHSMKLAPGKKVVTIYLPHLAVLNKFDVKVDDNAQVLPVADNRPKLLICGDSILQGMTCSSPAKASVVIAAKELDMILHNTSVGGAKMEFSPVEATLEFSSSKDDVIVVGFGANDAAQKVDLDYFRNSTNKILSAISNFAGKAVIISPIPAMTEFESRRPIYSNIVREEAAKFPKVKLLDGDQFFPANRADLYADGVHPNDEGMKIYATGLIQAVKEL